MVTRSLPGIARSLMYFSPRKSRRYAPLLLLVEKYIKPSEYLGLLRIFHHRDSLLHFAYLRNYKKPLTTLSEICCNAIFAYLA